MRAGIMIPRLLTLILIKNRLSIQYAVLNSSQQNSTTEFYNILVLDTSIISGKDRDI